MPLLCTPQRADLKVSATLGFQFSHDEPVRQQSGKKNQHGQREAGQVRAGAGDQIPRGGGAMTPPMFPGEVLKSRPYSYLFRRSARLKYPEQVSCGQPYQRSAHNQDDRGMSILDFGRRNQAEVRWQMRPLSCFCDCEFRPIPSRSGDPQSSPRLAR